MFLLSSVFAAFSLLTIYMKYPVSIVFCVQSFPVLCAVVGGNFLCWFRRVSGCPLIEWPYDIFYLSTLAYTVSSFVDYLIYVLPALLLRDPCLSRVLILSVFYLSWVFYFIVCTISHTVFRQSSWFWTLLPWVFWCNYLRYAGFTPYVACSLVSRWTVNDELILCLVCC